MASYRLSICIPAYNRARFLQPLLESIIKNATAECEVLIAEDCSPERDEIRAIAQHWARVSPIPIRYLDNPVNLGYDGNLRNLIEKAAGDYCLFMGNDDIMAPGAIERVLDVTRKHPDTGVIIRSYAIFYGDASSPYETVRQFPADKVFKPGPDTAVTFFRRTGVISSLTFHRESALAVSSDRWDGALYYQTYLASKILQNKAGYYVSSVQHLSRADVPPDFGHSNAEKGIYKPGEYTNAARLNMVSGLLNIATAIEGEGVKHFKDRVLADFGNYSHYLFVFQAQRSRFNLFKFYIGFCKLGFWKIPAVHAYFLSVLLLGPRLSGSAVARLRTALGSTPILGGLYTGESVQPKERL